MRSTITAVWELDRVPTPERMADSLRRMVEAIPRLRQRVVPDRPRPRWDDVDVDLTKHYVRTDLGGVATIADVNGFAQDWLRQPFDRALPQWGLALVSGLAGDRAAIVIKVHHAIADGIGLVLMLAAFTDLEPNPERPLEPPSNVVELPVERPVYSPWQRRWFKTKRGTQSFVTSPRRHLTSGIAVASSAMRLIWPSRTPLSPVMVGRSGRFCLDTRTVPFRQFKNAGRDLSGSLNDTFVTAVVDAIDRYHLELGQQSGSRTRLGRLRVHMPVDVRVGRTATVAGNQFVPARVTIDVPHGRPAHRVSSVRVQLTRLQDEPALTHINTVGAMVLRLGKRSAQWVLGGMMQGVDVLASNVPGPNFPLYVAGAKIEQFHAFGPPAGAAINVTLFSYDGNVNLGITTDDAAVTDRALFLRCIDQALASILDTQTTLAASA